MTQPSNRGQRRRHRANGTNEQGSISLFMVVAVLAMFAATGLVVDGGGKIRSLQHAHTLAAEAARAGGQAINPADAIQGTGTFIDTARAKSAAQAFLEEAHVQGTVTVVNGTRLRVQVTTSYQPVFLGLLGATEPLNTTASADVVLVRSAEGETS